MVGFDIQKELTFLGKGAPYPIFEIQLKNYQEFEAAINKLPEVDYIVSDVLDGINILHISPTQIRLCCQTPINWTYLK